MLETRLEKSKGSPLAAALGGGIPRPEDPFESLGDDRLGLGSKIPAVLALEVDLATSSPLRPLRALTSQIAEGEVMVLGLFVPGEPMSATRGRKLGVDLFGEGAVDSAVVVEGSADQRRFAQFLAGHGEA